MDREGIQKFMLEYHELCEKHKLFYGALCQHDGECVHEYPAVEPFDVTEGFIEDSPQYGYKNK